MAVPVEKASDRAARTPKRPVCLLWDTFRRRVEAVVQECNCEAGEPILGVTEGSDPCRLKIWHRTDCSSSVELALDLDAAVLSCNFGSTGRSDCWVFHLTPDGTSLHRAKTTYTVHDAVDAILDRLVCPRSPVAAH